ncbi:TPA: hypothetical protein DCQ44_01410, partial [Candidatus Taylorbacteria bacterium]|nr:hypothetical protein [Candidatus Taylorbacteria bacterium]
MKVSKLLFFWSALILICFFGVGFKTASAASLSIAPSSGSFSESSTLPIKIMVSSPEQPINAVSGVFSFPADKFSVVTISKAGSTINFWATDPAYSNSNGTVNFEGIILNPGFQGSSGVILTVYLRPKFVGVASFDFKNVSILANDGKGTDVTSGISGGTVSITAPVETKPAESKPTQAEPVATSSPNSEPVSRGLRAAEIFAGTKYGAPAIIGSSEHAQSQVLLTFNALDGTKIFINGDADETGSFSILVPNTLKRGSYRVSATMINTDGTSSVPSNEISIQVGNIFSDVPWQIWVMIALLVLLVIYLLLRILFHF